MKLYNDFSGIAVAIIISTIGAIVAAASAFVLIMFVGARLFNDELSYGIPLAFVVFVVIFQKIRSH